MNKKRMMKKVLAIILAMVLIVTGVSIPKLSPMAITNEIDLSQYITMSGTTAGSSADGGSTAERIMINLPDNMDEKAEWEALGIKSLVIEFTVSEFTTTNQYPGGMLFFMAQGSSEWNQGTWADLNSSGTLISTMVIDDLDWGNGTKVGQLGLEVCNLSENTPITYNISSVKFVLGATSGGSGGDVDVPSGSQTSTNSNSDQVKATITEVATNANWYEYKVTVSNTSSQSICGWVIKAYLPGVDLSGVESWDTCKLTYTDGYLYIEGMGDGSVVAAGGNNSTYDVKLGLGRSIGLDTSDIETITYEYGSEANNGLEDFEFNYTLTGQTKNLDFEDTPVGRHGKLHVDGIYLYDENNEKFQLRGASLHGIQWDVGHNYINKGAFQSLRDEWGINAIRLPVYVTQSGYTEGSSSAMDTYIQNAVNYATELGMYVLIDWHVHSATGETTNPNTWKAQANTFFGKYAQMYKDNENVLFEICNEPVNTPWYDGSGNDLYSYANSIIPTIRQYTDAVVIVGTNTWSQDVDQVASHKLSYANTMYTIHFYSATHMDNIRSKVKTALNAGVPVFCTEFGVCSADGNGSYNLTEADAWMDLFDQYSISYFCWQLSNKNEKSSYLATSSNKTTGGWTNSDLSTTGMWLINENRPKADAEDEKYASSGGTVESGETVNLAIKGTFNYDISYEILDLVNKERQAVGLSPLTMDEDLLEAAMLRSAEISVMFDHTRPNGEKWSGMSSKMSGENIATDFGNGDATGTVEGWMDSSGHKANILGSAYKSIGVGVFTNNGYTYYVQCFGNDEAITLVKPSNSVETVNVEVLKDKLAGATISFSNSNYSVKVGNTISSQINMVNLDTMASAWNVTLDPSNFTYSFNPTGIATISDGVITPNANGTTTLTAKLNADTSKKVTSTVSVSGFVESVSLNKSTLTLEIDGTKTSTLTATVLPSTASNKSVSWNSSNTSVATVNSSGKVTAVAPGTATITATTNSGNKTASCEVAVYGTYAKPAAPTLAAKTTTTVTLNKVTGCEYSKDGKKWQTSNVFTGLTPDTEYTFYVKKSASGYWLESDKSDELIVTTNKESAGGSDGGNSGSTEGDSGNTGGTTGGDSGNTGGDSGNTGGTTGGDTGNTGGTTSGDAGNTGDNTGGSSGDSDSTEPFVAPDVKVNYRTHIQNYGWEGDAENIDTWCVNGEMSGTSGESKRLEGINIVVNPATACEDLDLGIQYTTHCQNYGWLPWSADGDMNGTEGESKRLEAIIIKLTGEHADYYDVYYRVHAQNYGWLGWAKNGEAAGTAGYSKRLEGIQIVVVKKDEDFNHNVGGIDSIQENPFEAKEGSSPIVNYPATSNTNPIVPGTEDVNVAYRTHVQTYGWQGWKYNGQMSGTSGESKRLEGIEIKLTNKDYEGGIAYTTHVQTYGWQGDEDDPTSWMADGQMSGTSGESKRLEAIRIQLTGEIADHYDIYYRVHAQSYGWLGWAKNGEAAGTAGYSKRLEGIQIVIVPKGEVAPGSTYKDIEQDDSRAYIKK